MNKSISFYKPNSANKGSAAQFQYGAKENDYGLYISIVKQSGWNDSSKRGSFSENAKNPSKNKKIKLNPTEASAMCRVLESLNDKWSTVHKNETKTTSLSFSHYIKDGVKMGYGLSVSEKSAETFLLGLNNDEGFLLKIFLCEYIKFSFKKGQDQQDRKQENKF